MSKTKIAAISILSIVGIIGLFYLGMLIKIALFPAVKTGIAIDMTYKTTAKVLDADKALYNYEWFKQQKADIDSLKRKEVIAENSYKAYRSSLSINRSLWTREDRIEMSRLRTVYDGLKYQTSDGIAIYNARSKMVSRNIFKDNLPVSINRGLNSKNNL